MSKHCKKEYNSLKRAKEIIHDFLELEIEKLIKILGRKHPLEIINCTIGDIEEAFDLLDNQYNFFRGD